VKKYNVAVVGVGSVGIEMLRCLKQRNFPVADLKVFARSQRTIEIDGDDYKVEAVTPQGFESCDIALFAGTEGEKGAAKLYAHQAVKRGAVVIDNGSDFRLDKTVPLVIPEVNSEKIKEHKGIIANPNCTTIQLLVTLNQIHKKYGLEQILMSSYQATSGGGKKAASTLWEQTKQIVQANSGKDFNSLVKKIDNPSNVFSSQIVFNVLPQIGGFAQDNYTSEEWKTVNETHKIFSDPDIKISSTCVRVPVFTSHSESIYFRTRVDVSLEDIQDALSCSAGVVFQKDAQKLIFPVDTEDKDSVYAGRLRKDPFNKNSFWVWSVSDNLRKGAALNAVQIAESLIESYL
jgi:aspartate-semialdehyde dehydrogenase